MAKIIVNGEAQDVQLPLTLTELIKQNCLNIHFMN